MPTTDSHERSERRAGSDRALRPAACRGIGPAGALAIALLLEFAWAQRAAGPAGGMPRVRGSDPRGRAAPRSDAQVSRSAVEREGDRLAAAGDLLGGRARYWEALGAASGEGDRERIRRKIDRLSRRLLFSAARPKGATIHRVRPGDTLSRIARRYGITARLIMRMNGLTSDRIRAGDRLKVVGGPFDIRVEKRRFRLVVLRKGRFVLGYRVGLGRDGGTPAGTFLAGPKLVEPVWFDREHGRRVPFGHPEHPLGTRWITFHETYGIHGTNRPETIGRQASHGCVRMRNRDVEEVFDLVVPGRTRIEIVEGAGEGEAVGEKGR